MPPGTPPWRTCSTRPSPSSSAIASPGLGPSSGRWARYRRGSVTRGRRGRGGRRGFGGVVVIVIVVVFTGGLCYSRPELEIWIDARLHGDAIGAGSLRGGVAATGGLRQSGASVEAGRNVVPRELAAGGARPKVRDLRALLEVRSIRGGGHTARAQRQKQKRVPTHGTGHSNRHTRQNARISGASLRSCRDDCGCRSTPPSSRLGKPARRYVVGRRMRRLALAAFLALCFRPASALAWACPDERAAVLESPRAAPAPLNTRLRVRFVAKPTQQDLSEITLASTWPATGASRASCCSTRSSSGAACPRRSYRDGILLIARSAKAVIVNDGFTPGLADTAAPSITYRPG